MALDVFHGHHLHTSIFIMDTFDPMQLSYNMLEAWLADDLMVRLAAFRAYAPPPLLVADDTAMVEVVATGRERGRIYWIGT